MKITSYIVFNYAGCRSKISVVNLRDKIKENWLFYLALGLVVYMPLHVFIVQSASLVTGGIEIWKAAKDLLLLTAIPGMLYVAYKNN